jgi:hypothetical protein
MPRHCVLCFFLDVIGQVVAEHEAAVGSGSCHAQAVRDGDNLRGFV